MRPCAGFWPASQDLRPSEQVEAGADVHLRAALIARYAAHAGASLVRRVSSSESSTMVGTTAGAFARMVLFRRQPVADGATELLLLLQNPPSSTSTFALAMAAHPLSSLAVWRSRWTSGWLRPLRLRPQSCRQARAWSCACRRLQAQTRRLSSMRCVCRCTSMAR